jgi:serine/threonine protein kinase
MKRKSFMTDYNIVKEIGRGGFGCVYKVIMKNGNIFRAAKKIDKSRLKVDEHQNLLAEMAIMMHMDHPNITKLYEVYDEKTKYVLILELC